jgi:hypothetical protein
MEKALAAIHQSLTHGQSFSLEYGAYRGRVALFCRFPDELEAAIVGPLLANYPQAVVEDVTDVDDPRQCNREDLTCWTVDVRLQPELYPILRHAQYEDLLNRSYADPIDSLLRALLPADDCHCRIEFRAYPVSERRRRRAERAVRLLDRHFFHTHPRIAVFYASHAAGHRWRLATLVLALMARCSAAMSRAGALETSTARTHEREASLQSAADKLGGHVFEVTLRVHVSAEAKSVAQRRVEIIAGALGALTRSQLALFRASPLRAKGDGNHPAASFLCSHEELASLWYPPTATIGAERMQVSPFTEREPPADFYSGEEPGAVTVGRVRFRQDHRLIGLAQADRRRHVYVIGRTGTGKTNLLLNQIYSDLQKDHGLAVIDPHGDLAMQVMKMVPTHRTNDVVVFDPGDSEFAVPFNPLQCTDPARMDQVVSGAVSAFKRLFASWGPRLENTLRNTLFVTVEQGGTLLSALQLLTDEAYRERVIPRVRDPIVRAFWQHEFRAWNKAYRTEAIAAVTNKLQPFLTNRSVRATVSEPGASLNLREIMDDGRVLIVNLSKGRLGEDNAALLGGLLVTAIQQAAMSRADIPEEERRDFYFYVDEFHNFITTSFESILSEARKYRLNLTVSHQYRAQLDDATASAILGNVGSIVSFAVGEDSEWLASALAKTPGQLQPADLANLPRYTAMARLLVNGNQTNPLSINTLPPPAATEDRSDIVSRCSRRQYARPTLTFKTKPLPH